MHIFKNKYLIFGIAIIISIFLWRLGIVKSVPVDKVRQVTMPVAEVAPVIKKMILYNVSAPGTFIASQSVEIYNRVEGEVLEIYFKEGQMVKENDPLYTIDVKNLEMQLQQAAAALEKNTILLANAKKELVRNQSMRSKDIVSQSQLDQVKSTEQTLEAAIKNDQASIDLIKLQISYSKIKSPINGRIGFSRVDIKNFLKVLNSAPIPLTTVMKLDPIEFNFSLSEKYLSYFHKKDLENFKVSILDEKNTEKVVQGKIIAIDNNVNSNTGSIMLKAQFENSDFKFWHGQFASVKVTLEEKPDSLVVPLSAIQTGPVGSYVLVCDETSKQVSMRFVKLGIVSDSDAVVEEGLKLGELVIIAGQNRYKEGTKVEMIHRQDEKLGKK